jgi:hypothetical protein
MIRELAELLADVERNEEPAVLAFDSAADDLPEQPRGEFHGDLRFGKIV